MKTACRYGTKRGRDPPGTQCAAMSIRLQQNWSNSLLLIFAISIWKKERHKFCENLCVVTSKRDYYVQEHRSRLRGYVRSIMQTTQESKSRTQISSRGGRASNRRRSRLQAVSCLDGRLCCCNCRAPLEVLRRRKEESWRAYHQHQYLPSCCRGKEHHAWYPSPRTR